MKEVQDFLGKIREWMASSFLPGSRKNRSEIEAGLDDLADRLLTSGAMKPRRIRQADEIRRAKAAALTLPDPGTGLTDEEAAERKALGLTGDTRITGVRSTGRIILSHTFTWFNILNLFLGILVFSTGRYKNTLFLGVVISNSLIGIFQELKVRDLIRSLSVITAVKSTVLRNGVLTDLPVSEIVQHDILHLSAGDQIVADGPVLTSSYMEVNESMLTGESKPVRKAPGDALLSGSFVVAGSGVMRADQVGSSAYAAQLVRRTRHKRRASSEMQRTIRHIIRIVSVLIIPIGFLLYRSQMSAAVRAASLQNADSAWIYGESVVRTASGLIGMIPEGLVLLTSVSFIIGVGRLAGKRALVQEMEAIEALARADVLCTDKTGTITTGELKVDKLAAIGDIPAERIRSIMAHMGGAAAHPVPGEHDAPTGFANSTQIALDRSFGRKNDWPLTAVIPFSSDRKYAAAAFSEYGAFVLGAPEYLAPDRKQVLDYVKTYSSQGYRCLLLCSADGISADGRLIGTPAPMAVIIISDVIKPDAADTFAFFREAGVHVKVISGDDPATVSAVASRAGIEGADRYIDAGELPEDPALLVRAVDEYSVFGRVRPEQKQQLIRAFRAVGHTVAMVGDGVNDCLAIKEADCGIAMANGSDAARQAAHIVLADSDFSSMKEIIGEGRTIICNIERVSSLYLTKTIYSAILCVLFIFLRAPYPWTTLQMGLINLIGIGMPSFLMTFERHDDWKSKGFLIHVLKTCIPAALTMVSIVVLIQICNALFRWSGDMYSFFALMLGGLVALLVVAQVSWPFNRYRAGIFALCIGVFFAAVILLPGFYDIHSLWTPWSLLLIPLALLICMTIYYFSRLMEAVFKRMKAGDTGSVKERV